MQKHMYALTFLWFIVASCSLTVNTNEDEEKTSTGSTSKIRNNIQLQAKDLQVSQAFLVYEDGKLVPEDNATAVGQPVKMRLVIDRGWQVKNGKVAIGAAEKIETSDGDLVLDEKDLFYDLPEIKAEDAQMISLTANISQLDKLYDYFLVTFKVWDKNGTGEVNGKYKLYIR